MTCCVHGLDVKSGFRKLCFGNKQWQSLWFFGFGFVWFFFFAVNKHRYSSEVSCCMYF